MLDITLSDSFTLFFYAFHFKNFDNPLAGRSSLWSSCSIRPDSHFFFNHIEAFFNEYSQESNVQSTDFSIRIYEINTTDLSEEQRDKLILYSSFFNRKHTLAADDSSIDFFLCQEGSMLSPKLIIVPLTGVGILSFGIKITEGSSFLTNLQDINYHLRIFSSRQVKYLSTERKNHPRAFEQENKIKTKLYKLPDTSDKDSFYFWTFQTWIDYLLGDVNDRISAFSPNTFQVFTYANLKEELLDSALRKTLFRLCHVYNQAFIPSEEYLQTSFKINNTFEKISSAVSLEGASLLVQPDQNPFLQNYAQAVLGRTIWLYIIAYLQRYTFMSAIELSNELVHLTLEEMNKIYDNVIKVLFYFGFSEITHYSHQHEFYKDCQQNLKIYSLKIELKEKLAIVEKMIKKERKKRNLQNKIRNRGLFSYILGRR